VPHRTERRSVTVDIDRRLLRFINGRDDDLDLLIHAIEPRELPLPGPRRWTEDRLRFLHAAFVHMHRAARRPFSPAAEALFYDVGGRKPEVREMRRYFIAEYFGEAVDFVVADALPGGGAPQPLTAREKRAARRLRRIARLAALAACFDFSARRYRWWGNTLLTLHAYSQACDRVRRVYIGRLYDRRSYVVATYLARRAGLRPVLVYQSSPLAYNQRELHLDVPVVLTSKVNLPEVEYYQKMGWFKATEIRYCPQEYLLERQLLQPAKPVYDIGFFSSGDWARLDGKYWAPDIAQVRAGQFRGNPFEGHAERVLEALADYARAHDRTLRIYLHPYERRLVNDHGIELPFRHIADGEHVTIDDAPGTSRGAVYECDIAVALRSSTIWERIDLGLERSLIYAFDDPALDNLIVESLGPYQANVFHSTAELAAKLDRLLADREASP
jgi:hypothetical protein